MKDNNIEVYISGTQAARMLSSVVKMNITNTMLRNRLFKELTGQSVCNSMYKRATPTFRVYKDVVSNKPIIYQKKVRCFPDYYIPLESFRRYVASRPALGGLHLWFEGLYDCTDFLDEFDSPVEFISVDGIESALHDGFYAVDLANRHIISIDHSLSVDVGEEVGLDWADALYEKVLGIGGGIATAAIVEAIGLDTVEAAKEDLSLWTTVDIDVIGRVDISSPMDDDADGEYTMLFSKEVAISLLAMIMESKYRNLPSLIPQHHNLELELQDYTIEDIFTFNTSYIQE